MAGPSSGVGEPARLASLAIDDPMMSFLTGSTVFFTCSLDVRFSYCLYVPRAYRARGDRLPLVVSVHGASRTAEIYRDAFVDFAEEYQCVVLAPLIPMTPSDLHSIHNYKELHYAGTRYDQVVLAMVEEVADLWNLNAERFFLFGFSAGGQFAHRFAYMHPDRLAAVSAGAPGRITRPDPTMRWPDGLAGAAKLFGTAPDLAALAGVPLQLVVGAEDTQISPTAGPVRDGTVQVRNRIENVRLLRDELVGAGVAAELSIVPGAGHDALRVMPSVHDFLGRQLRKGEDD